MFCNTVITGVNFTPQIFSAYLRTLSNLATSRSLCEQKHGYPQSSGIQSSGSQSSGSQSSGSQSSGSQSSGSQSSGSQSSGSQSSGSQSSGSQSSGSQSSGSQSSGSQSSGSQSSGSQSSGSQSSESLQPFVIELPLINGEPTLGIQAVVDMPPNGDIRLPILINTTAEDAATYTACSIYRSCQAPSTRVKPRVAAVCTYSIVKYGLFGYVGEIEKDGRWDAVEAPNPAVLSARSEFIFDAALVRQILTVILSTKVSFWSTNYYVGQDGATGYLKKVLDLFGIQGYKQRFEAPKSEGTEMPERRNRFRDMHRAKGHRTKIANDDVKAKTDNIEASLKSTQTILLRNEIRGGTQTIVNYLPVLPVIAPFLFN
ncbi:hypothetical protein GJ496_001433 [Pomphorhynchus laevis]|nr:hypothetical protein GJ496_001433 [Pomphorhynchus laevis]